MIKKYLRRTTRAESLQKAKAKINNEEININRATKDFGILQEPFEDSGFGFEHERRMVRHIKASKKVGCSPDSSDVKSMAYSFAEKCSPGDDWFNVFIRRNKQLALLKSESLSSARSQQMNREDVDDFLRS
ncbi:hypothetical protein HHI36_014213 [Cryptolaemus montrouzieri]|uniref:HTH CENPB-type domain-containing protein n=1 Tax=Cryptolaemus montrouzieri TaxID=559131 RepID=A0ABD2N2N4_9CUCU